MWKKHTFFRGGGDLWESISKVGRRLKMCFNWGTNSDWLIKREKIRRFRAKQENSVFFGGAREVVERTAMDAFFPTADKYCSSHLLHTSWVFYSFVERCDYCRRLQNQGRERMTHAGGSRERGAVYKNRLCSKGLRRDLTKFLII